MFKQLSQLASLMQNLPKIRAEYDKLRERLSQIVAEGDAGGGMVKARVNGRYEVLRCEITDDALKLNDKEMLEDLIRAAINQAIDRSRQTVADETTKMASGFGLPAGIDIPGMMQ